MKKYPFKAFGVAILTLGLVFSGVASPAHAAADWNTNGEYFNAVGVSRFTEGSPTTQRISVQFIDRNIVGGTTYTVKLVGVTSTLSTGSCILGSADSGSFFDPLPGNATFVSKFANNDYNQTVSTGTNCVVASGGSGSSSWVSVKTTAPAVAAGSTSVTSTYIFAPGSLTPASGATGVTASVSDDDGTTWHAIAGVAAIAAPVQNNNQNNTPSAVSFTATATLVDANSTAITTLPASQAVPAFTATVSNPTNSASYSMVGLIFSRPSGGTEYFSLTNASNISGGSPASPSAWSPGACGITSVSVGGVAQSGSSGIMCQKQTWTFNSANAYALRIYLSSDTSAAVQVSVADSVFTSSTAGNYNFRFSLGSQTVNNSYFSGGATLPITVGGSGSNSPSTPAASIALNLGITTGQAVAGSNVAISASGLQATAPYEVILRSTPVTLATGNASNGSVTTSVTIPSGLEAGWHSLTFTSTASDGSTVTSVTYFKVSSSGTLLASTSTMPAELANTGINSATGISLLAGGLSLALVGAEMFMIARRKRSN